MVDTVTTQIVREAPEVEAQRAAVIKSAQDEIAKTLELPAYQAAGLSPFQKFAETNLLKDLGYTGYDITPATKTSPAIYTLKGDGISGWEDYLADADTTIGSGVDYAELGKQALSDLNLSTLYSGAQGAYTSGLTAAGAASTPSLTNALGYLDAGAGYAKDAGGRADDYLAANLANAQTTIGTGTSALTAATPDYTNAVTATNNLGNTVATATKGETGIAGGIAGLNSAQALIGGFTQANLAPSQTAINAGIGSATAIDPNFSAANAAASGIGQFINAADNGLDTVAKGTAGMGQAAMKASQYSGADLAASDAALRQGLSAASSVDPNFAASRAVANQLGTYADAADSGIGTIQKGVSGMTSSARDIGQYSQADLGRSQAFLGQAAQQARGADVDMGTANKAVRAGLQNASNVAEAALPAQKQAARTINLGIEGLLQGAEAYSPEAAQEFMNPYQQAVTQKAMQEMRRQANIARQDMAAQAVRAGAFGGTREGVQRAEFERNIQDQMQQKILQDYAQNYGQAQQAAMAGFEQQQQRQLGQGNLLGNLGLSQSEIGQRSAAAIAQEAALQGQLGTQAGALQSAQAQAELAQAQQLANIGTQMGQQELQQAQLGQQAETSEAAIYQNLVQAGYAPAQIAQIQSQIQAQRAGLLTDAQTRELQTELQRAQQITQSGQAMGQQAVQQAQLGQAATGLEANIYQNMVQAGYTPAQIAQVQGQMQAQQAGLLTDTQSRELQAELQRAQQLVAAGQTLGQQQIQQTQLGQQAAQALAGMSSQEAQAGMLYGDLAAQSANIYNQQAQNLANMETQEAQLGIQRGQQLVNAGNVLGQQELQQTQLGQQGVQNMAAVGQALGQIGAQQGQLSLGSGQFDLQKGQLYGQLGQGLGSIAGQQAEATLAKGQGLGSLGQQMASMGVQQAALGQAQQQLEQSDVSMLYNMGVGQQQNAQAQLDAARATSLQNAMQERNDVAFLSDVVSRVPSTQMSMSATTAPSTSPLQTIAGIGAGVLTGAGAASRAGII